MDVMLNKCLLGIITTKPDQIGGSGVPVFRCDSKEEMEQISFALGKLTGGVVHELAEGICVVVRH